MKKLIFILFSFFVLLSCATKDTVKNDKRTIRTKVVAVKVESNSTIISAGRLDNWYRIDTPLTEGMIYEVTLEIPRVVKDPLIIPANLLDFNPLDFLQRDLFGRYITKYQELKTAEKKDSSTASSDKQ